MNLREVGHAFGRDRTTVAHACRVIEERRDEPGLEALLSRLECDCALLDQPIPDWGRR
jgi:chromosomal replication initiation ATPase DnaA